MLRRLQAFVLLGVWVSALPALAQEPAADATSEDAEPGEAAPAAEGPTTPPAAEAEADAASDNQVSASVSVDGAALPPAAEGKPAQPAPAWDITARGYFRAPMAIGISPRPGPDGMDGPSSLQLSHGPTRTVDANYYSFAYTRLQEQDWAEMFVVAKKKHVEAAVGFMGYWFQAVGFRNNDAAWAPGLAYLKLDTDVNVAGVRPNVAFTGGAFWPSFGYFEKYDTYTLGRFRHIGEQLKLTVPLGDLELSVTQGFGAARDGIYNLLAPPPYQSQVGLGLLHYEHVRVKYKEYVDVGLQFNSQLTRDPNLFVSTTAGKSYSDARKAGIATLGGEVTVKAPRLGKLWVSPSYTRVRNGWALGEGGVELMHSLSAEGFATNYLAWNASPVNSSGSGHTINLGFLYENSLNGVLDRGSSTLPDVTLNVFGLLADAQLDLPERSSLTQTHIGQLKYGADVSVQATEWVSFMLRWDEVNYDLDNPGYVFSAITPRVTFSSHFLAGESIYLQYSRYRYGDAMVLAGKWPWGQALVAGNDIIQGGPYTGHKPDADVVKLQATVAF